MKVNKATIIRCIIFAVAVINRFLTSRGAGFNIAMDETMANALADLFLSIAGLVCLWYNNSFTKEAIEADAYMHDLKNGYHDEEDDDEEDRSEEQD